MSIRTPAAVVPPVFYSDGGLPDRRTVGLRDRRIAGSLDCRIAGLSVAIRSGFRKIPKIRPVLVEIYDSDPLKVRYSISDLRFCAGAYNYRFRMRLKTSFCRSESQISAKARRFFEIHLSATAEGAGDRRRGRRRCSASVEFRDRARSRAVARNCALKPSAFVVDVRW